ncbi:MAG: universal stress protein [Acidimicrobiales bacterium]
MTSPDSQSTKRVVVGIDGSSSSAAAAESAAQQAERTGSTLYAITTWHSPSSFGYPMPILEGFDPADEAMKVVDEAVRRILGRRPVFACSSS